MPLRDLLLTGIIGSTLPFVFRHAFIGILLWTWVGVMNPHKLTYGYMYDAPVAAVIGGITLLALFTTRDRVKPNFSAPLAFVGLFVLWTFVTTAFSIFTAESFIQLEKIVKIQLMTLVAAAVLYKWEHIRLFVWVNVLSLAFYGVKGGLFTIMTGGDARVWGPPGGFIGGNNELALALIMAIPVMNFLRLTTPHRWARRALLVMMLLSSVSAIGTQSRGALVAIISMGAMLWWRAPNKLLNAVAVLAIAVSAWFFMPESWHARMATIQNYEEDGSAMGRIFAWQTAINVANDRVFGAGYEMYNSVVFDVYAPERGDSQFDSTIARAAHSIFFQVLGEHGYIGLFLFMMIWLSGWFIAASLRRGSRGDPEVGWLYHLGSMAQVSFVGWFTGGAFLSLAYWDFPYSLVVVLVCARRWRAERTSMPEIAPPVPPPDLAKRGIGIRAMWWLRSA